MSPVKFLQNKQQGAPVANADRKVIEKLIKNYSFSNEVMNVLIEYCLNQTQQKFSKAYVEKVAASWIRLQVDSKEKALEVCRQENHCSICRFSFDDGIDTESGSIEHQKALLKNYAESNGFTNLPIMQMTDIQVQISTDQIFSV